MFQFVLHLHYDVLHFGMIGFAASRIDFASHFLCYETKFFPLSMTACHGFTEISQVIAQACGYKGVIYDKCPVCQSENIMRMRRITGYLTGDLSTWNSAKRAEERDRVKHG